MIQGDTMRYSLLVLVCLFIPIALVSQELDTLRYYASNSEFIYYDDPAITMQAARFDLPAPGYIRSVKLLLGGESGTARLHLYGHEGGVAAPLLQRSIIEPITIRKSRTGLEQIDIVLPNPPFCGNNQIFVALDIVEGEITLLSDYRAKSPSCTSARDSYYYQLLKLADNSWRWGIYSYAIDLEIEYPSKLPRGYLADVTIDAKLDDSLSNNRSIGWHDINGDSFIDLLVDGRLYRNNGDGSFADITTPSGISGRPKANVFIDLNNDAHVDILFLGSADEQNDASPGIAFINAGDGSFKPSSSILPLLTRPTSASIADVDGDGYLDLFVGQSTERMPDTLSSRLLINDRNLGFIDRTEALRSEERRTIHNNGSQWVDFNNDGAPDLYVVGTHPTGDEIWENAGDGSFANTTVQALPAGRYGSPARGRGCAWADYDNDGDMDLLRPLAIPVHLDAEALSAGAIMANSGHPRYETSDDRRVLGIEYEEDRTGGAWGDVNNDGLLDFVTTTTNRCRFSELYLQEPGGSFTSATFEYGLFRISAGDDAIWADYDNDGKLDLITTVNGRLRLFKNSAPAVNNYLLLDMVGQHAVGARVTVTAGEMRYTREVTSGRGLLMQEPTRLHFGIGGANRVDSVIVRWNNGRTERITDLEANKLHAIREGEAQSLASGDARVLSAVPNPFSTRLVIAYEMSARMPVTLGIYTVDGEQVKMLVDGTTGPGTHEAVWDGSDEQGSKMPQGTYMYRLKSMDHETTGRIVLIR